jgi:hypothetical protein
MLLFLTFCQYINLNENHFQIEIKEYFPFIVLSSPNMLWLRRHLGSSQFPVCGNVRVNILVAKRGAYGLKSDFSQARP